MFFCLSDNSESICLIFIFKYHTKTFDWTADLFVFVVKRGRLRLQQAEGQPHDTASAPISVDCPRTHIHLLAFIFSAFNDHVI